MLTLDQITEEWLMWARFHFPYMTVMWIICMLRRNGSMVDFGWPSGFFTMAAYYLSQGEGWYNRRLLICVPYLLCGFRFMFGWAVKRKHHLREDKRWELWRARWSNGEGWFGITSVPLNFFFFYHAQSSYNIFFCSFPLMIMSYNKTEGFHPFELIGIVIWMLSFVIENKADFTLGNFARKNRGSNPPKVCKEGLWYYSRHPNYFAEFLLWCAYSLMCIPSLSLPEHYAILFMLPFGAYYFLVHFTGAWMAEQSSVKRRPEYKEYQETTNMIIPWWPSEAAQKKTK